MAAPPASVELGCQSWDEYVRQGPPDKQLIGFSDVYDPEVIRKFPGLHPKAKAAPTPSTGVVLSIEEGFLQAQPAVPLNSFAQFVRCKSNGQYIDDGDDEAVPTTTIKDELMSLDTEDDNTTIYQDFDSDDATIDNDSDSDTSTIRGDQDLGIDSDDNSTVYHDAQETMEAQPLRLVPEVSRRYAQVDRTRPNHVFQHFKSKAVKVRVVRADSPKVKGTVRIPLK